METDEITIAARNSDSIMKFGANFVQKIGGDSLNEFLQGIRQLARLQTDLRRT